jgi:RNA ligase (TIGR02306 family)
LLILYWILGLLGLKRSSAGVVETTSPRTTDTEFTAEVVRISRLIPHPNADRLEIARFEMAATGETTYEVVIQKGQYKPGNLAAYLSVDCIVPTDRPEFAFLTTRLDGKGKTHYRLKAARLRGVFSQGLLVDAPVGKQFGESVADTFGVTYYAGVNDEPRLPTQPSAKPKVQPAPIYGVESLKKAPRLFEDGEGVVITEKIHGCNFRFGWVPRRIPLLGITFGWRFFIGSHRAVKGAAATGPGFYKEDLWLDAAKSYDLARRTKDYRGYVFYGELFGYTKSGTPIQELTYGRSKSAGPGLVVFDVLQPGGTWMDPFRRRAVVADIGLDHAPLLELTTWGPQCYDHARSGLRSTLDAGTIREGFVVETDGSRPGPRRKAKFVGEDYLLSKKSG